MAAEEGFDDFGVFSEEEDEVFAPGGFHEGEFLIEVVEEGGFGGEEEEEVDGDDGEGGGPGEEADEACAGLEEGGEVGGNFIEDEVGIFEGEEGLDFGSELGGEGREVLFEEGEDVIEEFG